MKRAALKGRKRHNAHMDLGDLYKNKGEDYMKDRKFVDGDEFDDEDDLSPTRGAKNERLPALENCVENSGYKFAITEPHHPKNPLPARFGQKVIDDMIRVGTLEYENYVKVVQEVAEAKLGNHFICLTCWKYLSFH